MNTTNFVYILAVVFFFNSLSTQETSAPIKSKSSQDSAPTNSTKAISGLTAGNVGRPMEMGVVGSFMGRTVQSREAICNLGFGNLVDSN